MLTQGSPLTGKSRFGASDSRRALEAAVEAALSLLDAMDGDPDLEEGSDDDDDTGDAEPDHDASDQAHADIIDQRGLVGSAPQSAPPAAERGAGQSAPAKFAVV